MQVCDCAWGELDLLLKRSYHRADYVKHLNWNGIRLLRMGVAKRTVGASYLARSRSNSCADYERFRMQKKEQRIDADPADVIPP